MRLSRRRMLLAPLALGGPLLFPRALSAKPLWPGARYSEERRTRAMQRGLRFIYATAVKPKHFAEYGDDYLWCFYTISNTAADPALKRVARTMGEERARAWRRLHPRVPADADANDISSLVFGSQAADQLGLRDGRMEDALRRAAARFRAADYLSFDPMRELPPADVPDTCARCDNDNPRGTRRCRTCGNKLDMTDPYEVLCDALIATYTGDRYGVRLGASYPEVTALLPKMRPYRGYDGGQQPALRGDGLRHHPHHLHHERLRHLAAQAPNGCRPSTRSCARKSRRPASRSTTRRPPANSSTR